MKFKEYNQEQPWLIPPDIEDEIPENDLCRVINDIIDIIDTNILENEYKEEGNPAYHPKMMIKILFYSYSQRIFSSRRIAKELERNIFYWYLSGNQRPDFRTICLFRKNHLNKLKLIFREITNICIQLGLVDFKTIAIDGTKIKANASKDKFRDQEWLEREINEQNLSIDKILAEAERLDKEEDNIYGSTKRGDELPEEISDKKKRIEKLIKLQEDIKHKGFKRINETDAEAKIMKSQGSYIPAYNCQAMVDEKNQIILSADVIDEPNDWYQIKPNVEEIKETYSMRPETILGDRGYCDGETLEYLHNEKIDGYIPDKKPKDIKAEIQGKLPDEKKYKKGQFKYDREKDVYICPDGKELSKASDKMRIDKRKKSSDVSYHAYRCTMSSCPNAAKCHNNKRGRIIKRYHNEEIREDMAKKIRSPQGWGKYSLRMKIVEPVFGNIKYNMGFNRFSLRGLIKTRGEFFILTGLHNIMKIKKYLKENKMVNLKTALSNI